MKKLIIIFICIFFIYNAYAIEPGVLKKMHTPYTGQDEVYAISKQLYSTESFAARVSPERGEIPYIIRPNNQTVYVNSSSLHCGINASSGIISLPCWFEYQFNSPGMYILGNFNASSNQSKHQILVNVQDNLEINKINHYIKLIRARLGI